MGKINTFILVLIFIIVSCNDKESKKILSLRKSKYDTTRINKAISRSLYKEILWFINYNDSLTNYLNSPYVPPVYEIELSYHNDSCFVSIISSDFFHWRKFQGFLNIKNKIIAFYNPNDKCNSGLINGAYLVKHSKKYEEGSVKGRPESIERKFKILGQDSLKLISFNIWSGHGHGLFFDKSR